MPGFYEKLVLRTFEGMHQGYMRIHLPDGRMYTYGNANAELQATIQVRSNNFFKKCALYGDIGFGEAYVDGDWDTDSVTRVIRWFLLNVEQAPTISGSKRRIVTANFLKGINRLYHRLRENTVKLARKNIQAHYDLSNEFFKTFLDASMTYSSAYFRTPDMSLEAAQTEKYDRLCRQLKLKPTDHVLEIGSGWGGFALHAVKHYGCKITTITISEEQYHYARARFAAEGFADRISILFTDYRNVSGQFDKIVSIEMLEAVGHRYFKTYFAKLHEVLKPNGLVGLQVIICPDSRYTALRKGVDWIQKHIFPGSLLPSVGVLHEAAHRTGDLSLVDLKHLGRHYARTLATWRDRFNQNNELVQALGFDESFRRKWNYYLSYCEAAFESRNIGVVQMIWSRPNNMLVS